jgi:hypothetical protein
VAAEILDGGEEAGLEDTDQGCASWRRMNSSGEMARKRTVAPVSRSVIG